MTVAGDGATDARAATFAEVDGRLRAILEPYRGQLSVTPDGRGGMALELPGFEGQPWGYVAGVRTGKSYVSFYLMPLYADPSLSAAVSPALAKRRQGKACFNFTRVDDALFDELSALTARTIPGYLEEARRRASDRAR